MFLTSVACENTVAAPVQTDGALYEKDIPKDLLNQLSKKSSLKMPGGAKVIHYSYSNRDYSSSETVIFSIVPFNRPNLEFTKFSLKMEKILVGIISDKLPNLVLGDFVDGLSLSSIRNKHGKWDADYIDTTKGYYLYLTGIK